MGSASEHGLAATLASHLLVRNVTPVTIHQWVADNLSRTMIKQTAARNPRAYLNLVSELHLWVCCILYYLFTQGRGFLRQALTSIRVACY